MPDVPEQSAVPAAPQVVIAGFGVPGHAAAELLAARGIPFVVIDRNPDRQNRVGVTVVTGDARDEQVLRQAGVEAAQWLILAIPDDSACLAAIDAAKRLNPGIRIIARCVFTSGGLQATARGAERVIVAEQVVARELSDLLSHPFPDRTARR